MNNEWPAILSFCASSALGVSEEPPIYAPLRLIEVLEKLLRFGEREHITADVRLSELADMIRERKTLCMDDETAFRALLQEVAFSLVDIMQGNAAAADSKQRLQPAPLRFFAEIAQIPRASGDEKKIEEYLKSFAMARNLDWKQDGAGNILIYKPGQGGDAGGKPIIIQSHMDMVYVKARDSSHVYEEPLPVKEKDGWIFSEGTSLGADNGIGAAYALAVLDSGSIPHPDVYALFTVNEENGLIGANAMGLDFLPADRLLNIDGEEEGVIIAGCAGAVGASINKKVIRKKAHDPSDINMCLEIRNLLGGHSGLQIHLGRANAVKIVTRVLYELSAVISLRIISLSGGEKMNVIPDSARAVFTIAEQDREKLEKKLNGLTAMIKAEYASTDPDMDIAISAAGSELAPLSDADSLKVLQLLMLIPDGVIEMNHEVNGLVQTSNNLGTIRTEEDALIANINIRSAFEGQKYYILSRISAACELTGAEIEVFADYPAWEYRADSDFRESCMDLYRNMFGKAPEINVIHGGLECGAFWKLKEGIEMVSIGPDILDVHSVNERLDISSALRVWEFVQRILIT